MPLWPGVSFLFLMGDAGPSRAPQQDETGMDAGVGEALLSEGRAARGLVPGLRVPDPACADPTCRTPRVQTPCPSVGTSGGFTGVYDNLTGIVNFSKLIIPKVYILSSS